MHSSVQPCACSDVHSRISRNITPNIHYETFNTANKIIIGLEAQHTPASAVFRASRFLCYRTVYRQWLLLNICASE